MWSLGPAFLRGARNLESKAYQIQGKDQKETRLSSKDVVTGKVTFVAQVKQDKTTRLVLTTRRSF